MIRIRGDARPWLPLLLLAATASAWASGNPPRTLAAGEFRLPAATAFGAPGFHDVVTTADRVRSDLHPPAHFRLVLTLRDATRPQRTCSSDHPLSGCATVDWADDSSRPKVPPSGVFANTVTVQLDSGKSTFFLTPGGALARRPNQYQARMTAYGRGRVRPHVDGDRRVAARPREQNQPAHRDDEVRPTRRPDRLRDQARAAAAKAPERGALSRSSPKYSTSSAR